MSPAWWQWSARWALWREDRAVRRRPIAPDLWRRTLNRYPFLRRRDPADEQRLQRMCSLFLDRKEFSAVGRVRLGNDVVVAVAAQACLPALRLGLSVYDGFVGIVLHEDAVLVRRETRDEAGVVHDEEQVLAGEAMDGGPLMLSWRDVRQAGQSARVGYNVAIHEFAHVMDMRHGLSGDEPALPAGLSVRHWVSTLARAYESHAEAVDRDEETLLDPYGAQAPEEFFAVASEAFFVAPQRLLQTDAALYELLKGWYRQDPAVEMPPPRPFEE
ncbi:MAG: zinc-dependent peptidase [Rubrivivax sp.]|jgi:Mlc titration factor MtfA (ptsG expression regulator)